MVADVLRLLPVWLLAGSLLGLVATAFVVAAFYLGDRFLPATGATAVGGDSGVSRRHEEIREYLAAIDERFLENHPLAGSTVAFYLPDREVAITFDAHLHFRLKNAGTQSVLCEHEMPGRGLGRRLPFDVPRPTFDTRPNDDPIAAAFDELGLSRTAGEEAVKNAYRDRIKEVHPDHGGDEESFRRVREAYTTVQEHRESDGRFDGEPSTVRDRKAA
ncbi:J domain-containing protein [Halopenitus sp. H-Gu1]|uniref:J domain-containing protein n=1 Tax=Halopenitus sp. H-Gu1 TaxID=3242697 RepID=UPI00359E61C5